MPLTFSGIAHPPPQKERRNVADLSRAEIATTNMGKGGGTDLLLEHDHGAKVGTVHASWEGRNGELHVLGVVNNEHTANQVRNGKIRGLSLGTGVIQDVAGNALLRTQDEVCPLISNVPFRCLVYCIFYTYRVVFTSAAKSVRRAT
jgi:hypothetical protein